VGVDNGAGSVGVWVSGVGAADVNTSKWYEQPDVNRTISTVKATIFFIAAPF
jgi:hypothetical protein